jgi:hypothetical protein
MVCSVFRTIGLAFGLWLVSAAGCSGNTEGKKSLSEGCVTNSDCSGSLVCSFGHCHQQCATTKDCPTSSRCVAAADGSNACQLPQDEKCQYNSDCPSPLVCALDGACRNQCQQDRDCVRGQVCTTSKVCAEPAEVDTQNNLVVTAGTGGSGGVASVGGAPSGGVATPSGGSANPSGGKAGVTGGAASGGAPTGGTGTGGTPRPLVLLYTFDSANDCAAWSYANNSPAPAYDISRLSTLDCDGTTGQPDSPSLRVVAPFNAYLQPDDQRVDIQFLLPGAPVDLTGRVISVWIKLDSGFVGPDSSSPGGIVLYAKSGPNWDWGQAPWCNLINPRDVGRWVQYSFDLSAPDPGSKPEFDPSQIQSIGISIDTGAPTAPLVSPSTGTFHVDSIGYQ